MTLLINMFFWRPYILSNAHIPLSTRVMVSNTSVLNVTKEEHTRTRLQPIIFKLYFHHHFLLPSHTVFSLLKPKRVSEIKICLEATHLVNYLLNYTQFPPPRCVSAALQYFFHVWSAEKLGWICIWPIVEELTMNYVEHKCLSMLFKPILG